MRNFLPIAALTTAIMALAACETQGERRGILVDNGAGGVQAFPEDHQRIVAFECPLNLRVECVVFEGPPPSVGDRRFTVTRERFGRLQWQRIARLRGGTTAK